VPGMKGTVSPSRMSWSSLCCDADFTAWTCLCLTLDGAQFYRQAHVRVVPCT
jgi:hypothetical protein